ncbi:MAG: glycoside hydrolase family 18 protein, partial [Bacteroidota bacterium]|nr:glycoside hydrolase family 18 protein [Bacteroidota bacterium]
MKNWLSLLVVLVTLVGCSTRSAENSKPDSNMVVLAYVTSWSQIMPDPAYVTHINYAFGHVNNEFNGIRVDNEERLTSIVGLKREKPSLKVMLSIGGWGSGRFSEMAADEENRKAFAADCGRVVEQFGLDGIDMDWEYPTSSSANISSSPDDTQNFTLLMRDIREVIGKDKLLTFASVNSAKYVDFVAVEPYVDFVNIMTYDMALPPFHHSGLYRSHLTRRFSVEESVEAHVNAGIPIDRLTLGIPFYGRGSDGVPNFVDYKDIVKLTGYTINWDDVAKAPYLTDADGKLVFTYETPRSIALKCAFLREKGMLGAMYWDYNGDDAQGTLRKAVY